MKKSSQVPSYPIKSVGNALELLLEFRANDRLTVTRSAELLGVAPSTAHRLLTMLTHYGFVTREQGSRAYRAGPALLGIGLAALRNYDLRTVARPHIEKLVEDIEETVNLLVLEDDAVRFVECIETPTKALRVASRVGLRRPAHATSVGKALLAQLPTDEVDTLFSTKRSLEALTLHTLIDRGALEKEFSQIRERGFATNFGESDEEIRAVGVPIRTRPGQPLAGLAVSAPSSRLPEDRIDDVVDATKATVRAIEFDLGL